MKNLLIIDGSSLLSTSFYGTCPREYYSAKTSEQKEAAFAKLLKTTKGVYTNGVYTFIKTLMNILKNQAPSHIAVVFDTTRNTFRREMSADYKANRKETPNPLKQQFVLTENLLKEIGIPVFMGEFEADDYAGSLAKKFENELPVFLHTKDEDYLQLISEYTRVWLVTSKANEMYSELGLNKKDYNIPEGVFEYTTQNMKELKGLNPIQIIDYKALCGDSSDNISGVKGVGEKAVIPLLQEYDTVEEIYNQIDGLDEKEEKELSKFFKESLGISRSPIKTLTKEGTIILSDKSILVYKNIDEPKNEEDIKLQEFYKEKLGKLALPIKILSEDAVERLEKFNVLSVEPSAKESAYLSKKLATIKTDIDEIQSVKLDDLVLNLKKDKYKEKMLELEMKSLLNL